MPKLNFACHTEFPPLTAGPREATVEELLELLAKQQAEITALRDALTQLQSRETCLHCARAKSGWLGLWGW